MATGSSRRPSKRRDTTRTTVGGRGSRRDRQARQAGSPTRGTGSGTRPAFLDQGQGQRGRGRATKGGVTTGREKRERHARERRLHSLGHALVVLLAVVAVLGAVYLVLRNAPVFEIQSIETEATEHVTMADIQNLLTVPEGTTLLNVDEGQIQAELSKNPWVASVSIERDFPGTLRVTVNERKVGALVLMGSGSMAWYLGEDNVWIMPAKVSARSGQSVTDAALAMASDAGTLLIVGVPDTVSPVSGSEATDAELGAVQEFRDGFSADFSSQIVSYSAASADNVTCTLASGVEISLGSPTSISSKETVAKELISRYADELTYINVRVPSNPSYRRISSDQVQAGTGAAGNAASDSVVVGGGTGSGEGGETGTGSDGGAGSGTTGTSTTGTGSSGTATSTTGSGTSNQGTGSTGSSGSSADSGTSSGQ